MLETIPVMAGNLLAPAVLFFALGAAARLLRSDLAVPREVTSGLGLYLMMSVGFRGGYELVHAGLTPQVAGAALSAIGLGLILPVIAFTVLTRWVRLDPLNAGAVAAHYGSVSAVTFVIATSVLAQLDAAHGGYMVAVMALMEAPGIISGILLARAFAPEQPGDTYGAHSVGEMIREAVTGGSVLMLLGSFAVGMLTGDKGMVTLKPFLVDPFQGALALFLLDMGLRAADRLPEFLRMGWRMSGFGVLMPVVGGTVGVLAGKLIGLGVGDTTLLATLSASASYIAAPAAVRLALPQANPSFFMPLALGITFPFNVLVGIPLYYSLARFAAGL